MANLAASAVVAALYKPFAGMAGKDLEFVDATVTLATMGSATNKVLASAFGLTKVVAVFNVVKSDETRLIATPSFDGSYIQLMDPVNATNLGADFSGSFRFTLIGY